jgi:hypothetical protein
MPKLRRSIPSYSLHKRSGQAVVRLAGTDFYLGPFDSPESRERYDRFVAEWLANGRRPPEPKVEAPTDDGLTIDELIVRYLEFARVHYRKNDAPTKELGNIKVALRPVHQLYGSTPAASIGPKRLKTVRERMIADGLARGVINHRVGRIVRAFKWAGSEELVPATVFQISQDRLGAPTRTNASPRDRTGQARPGSVRGRDPAPRRSPGLGNGRVATLGRDAAGRSDHHADGRSRHVGPGLGLPAVGPQDDASGSGSGGLSRAPGPRDPSPLVADKVGRVSFPAPGSRRGTQGRDAAEPEDQGSTEATRPVQARRPTQAPGLLLSVELPERDSPGLPNGGHPDLGPQPAPSQRRDVDSPGVRLGCRPSRLGPRQPRHNVDLCRSRPATGGGDHASDRVTVEWG